MSSTSSSSNSRRNLQHNVHFRNSFILINITSIFYNSYFFMLIRMITTRIRRLKKWMMQAMDVLAAVGQCSSMQSTKHKKYILENRCFNITSIFPITVIHLL
jgi:hypothetical protein